MRTVKKDTLPSIRKRRNNDNSFEIEIRISKSVVDNRNLMRVIPIFFNNQTERLSNVDYYHLKLPKNPHYVRRTMKVEDTSKAPLFEIFTVSSKVKIKINQDSPYIHNMLNSSYNTSHLEQDTLHNIKLLTSLDVNSTLINMDKYYPLEEKTENLQHDDSYYRTLNSIKKASSFNETHVLNYYVENARNGNYEINFNRNLIVPSTRKYTKFLKNRT